MVNEKIQLDDNVSTAVRKIKNVVDAQYRVRLERAIEHVFDEIAIAKYHGKNFVVLGLETSDYDGTVHTTYDVDYHTPISDCIKNSLYSYFKKEHLDEAIKNLPKTYRAGKIKEKFGGPFSIWSRCTGEYNQLWRIEW